MSKTAFGCSACGYRSYQWVGRCPGCGEWDTLAAAAAGSASAPTRLGDLDPGGFTRIESGIGELDRVLGGGIVAGSIVLLAGEPGVGKSTLMLQAAAGFCEKGKRVLVVCGEESLDQVAARARRVGAGSAAMGTDVTDVCKLMPMLEQADVVIVDSIQTLKDPELQAEAGSVTQVRASASALAGAARRSGAAVILIGHVTKDGGVAGPRVLEHVVDAVLMFEGDSGHSLRTVRGIKNRFGSTGELGLFEMDGSGLKQVTDASGLFLGDRMDSEPGSAVGCAIEGRRPLAVEIQTLVVEPHGPARRIAQGIEGSRLSVVLAVLESRAHLNIGASDVYASIAGGFRSNDPAIDLALALSLASASRGEPIPKGVAAVGEIGLGGAVRPVPGVKARIKELARLGFTQIIAPVSKSQADGDGDFANVKSVHRLSEAISLVL